MSNSSHPWSLVLLAVSSFLSVRGDRFGTTSGPVERSSVALSLECHFPFRGIDRGEALGGWPVSLAIWRRTPVYDAAQGFG